MPEREHLEVCLGGVLVPRAALELVREVGRDQRAIADIAAFLERWAKPKD